ncbi:Metal transporter CNNM3 [Thelohanellus kitauei]|uniref:Metal transporter CNNM3 n=1 Tax=Thelohanellus kitauei TaxID=669202 RepID=A0A0C2JVU3_THEKT|nr:Metal transporter CNNM3 [Thelohanellus kitauei]
MLERDDIVNQDLIKKIHNEGYSRIPIFKNVKSNVIGILHLTDIILLNPFVKIQVNTILNFHKRNVLKIPKDLNLASILQKFVSGVSHLAIIHDQAEEEGSSYDSPAIGIITLHDVIHEILGIDMNEKNINPPIAENERTRKCSISLPPNKKFRHQWPKNETITSHLSNIIANFLKNEISAFKDDDLITIDFLNDLINTKGNILLYEQKLSGTLIYKKNFPCDYFVLIIDGNVKLSVGSENLSFTQKPYHYFGSKCLETSMKSHADELFLREPYIPDYDLRTVGRVTLLKIKAKHLILKLNPTAPFTLSVGNHGQKINRLQSSNSLRYSSSICTAYKPNPSPSIYISEEERIELLDI